jgi:tRNA A37 threonylcarbamoyladenosine modification protein TsaB
VADAADRLRDLAGLRLVGPGAALLGAAIPTAEVVDRPAPDLAALGRLASDAPAEADVRPLYLRAPDAWPKAP